MRTTTAYEDRIDKLEQEARELRRGQPTSVITVTQLSAVGKIGRLVKPKDQTFADRGVVAMLAQ